MSATKTNGSANAAPLQNESSEATMDRLTASLLNERMEVLLQQYLRYRKSA